MTWLFAPLRPYSFGAIGLDLPWGYETWSGELAIPSRAKQQHYKPMRFEEMLALPIGRLAARDTALLLWTFGAHHHQALALGEHYGFEFKTVVFTWRKPKASLGKWTRRRTEHCLLFTRGSPRRLNADVDEMIEEAPREHSRKPEEFYRRAERLVAGPYVEIFATTPRPGWAGWGDQYGKYQLKKEAAE